MHYFAVLFPLWSAPPSLYIYTISSLLIFFWRLLPVLYCLSHNIPGFHTSRKLGTKPLPLLCTILDPIIVPLLGCLFHSAPLLFFLTLLLSFSSTLAMLLVAWPHVPPHLPLLSFLHLFPNGTCWPPLLLCLLWRCHIRHLLYPLL